MKASVADLPAECLTSAIRSDDDPVLAGRPLQLDVDRETLPRFGDDLWNLRPAIFRENARTTGGKLDFASISDPEQRLIAKELLYAKLNERVQGLRQCMDSTTSNGFLVKLKRFFAFVEAGAGRVRLGDIDQGVLDGYLAALRSGGRRTPPTIAHLIEVAIDLHRYRAYLTGGGISFAPWKGRPAFVVAGCVKQNENTTPRIPEPIVGAILRWSLKYVECFAPDILAARREHEMLEAGCEAMRAARKPGDNLALLVRRRIAKRIDHLRAQGRGMPVWCGGDRKGRATPPFNYPLLALHAGCNQTYRILTSDPTMRLIVSAFDELGAEAGGMDTPISIDPDTGEPWRERFDSKTLAHEEKMLQAACYIVCIYLTGMRDSEVQAMRAGCHVVARSADRKIERHKIRSISYKWRGPEGALEEWVTIPPAGRAVDILEDLTEPTRRQRGCDDLWLVLNPNARNKDKQHIATDITRLLNLFRDHLDTRFGSDGEPAIPHAPYGNPWHFTSRQFRRTVAWYIANRPFGSVAGKIQYKHASLAMFEGYAGASRSGFRSEIESERELGQLDDIVTYYENARDGAKPAGPAAARLCAEFERVRDDLDDFPGRVVDTTRLRAMLKQIARTLYVGHLNDCFFEPAAALCLKQSGRKDRTAPILSHCSPDRCPNSSLTARHLPPWEASIEEADRLLADKRLPPLQRKALEAENARKRRLITPLKENADETDQRRQRGCSARCDEASS